MRAPKGPPAGAGRDSAHLSSAEARARVSDKACACASWSPTTSAGQQRIASEKDLI